MRDVAPFLALFLCISCCGCGLMRETTHAFTPNTTDYDEADIYDHKKSDEWSSTGREGRGDRPIDRDGDGLTKHIYSDKAQRIAQNLGVESP